MKTIREILALPFLIIGLAGFKLAELIAGEKMTYRAGEVLDILDVNAICTQCGHTGKAFHDR